MTIRASLLLVAASLAVAAPALAAIEEGYDPAAAPVPSTWYEPASPAALQADRDYIAGMRPHHAGALSMSREYLADPQASSPVLKALAQAIIRNQSFEIGLLDEVARNLDRPPLVLDLGIVRLALQPAATEGMAQMRRFIRSPIPGPLAALAAGAAVAERDVQFAKGMTIHHQAALDMARAYHANPEARNGFLGLLNTDIITDQSQEIALMRSAIAAYPGDAAAVRVDPSTIHGMEGMRHGGSHGGHAAPGAGQAPDGAGHGSPAGHGGMPMPQAAPHEAQARRAARPARTEQQRQPARQAQAVHHDPEEHGGHMH